MNRKGFTYVLSVALLLAVIVLVFLTGIEPRYQDDTELVRARVVSMNDFVTNLESDINRATYITSFRALLSLEDYVASQGEFLNDTEVAFIEAFENGTIVGTNATLMNDSTFTDYLNRVNALGGEVGFSIDLSIQDVQLFHLNPWSVAVAVNLTIVLDDNLGVATWNTTETFVTEVPIFDLRDPLYSSNTQNRVVNTIRQFPYDPPVNESNTTTYLEEFANTSAYLANTEAPSFLQRFENNISPSPYGIESIVNVVELSTQDISVDADRVKLDYIYFNNQTVASTICDLENVASELAVILPDTRVSDYNLGGINYSTSC